MTIFDGAYIFRKLAHPEAVSDGTFVFEIARTDMSEENYLPETWKTIPTLGDMMELFDNSFLLEFLIGMLQCGVIVPHTLNKTIYVLGDGAVMHITAQLSPVSADIPIIDYIETDATASYPFLVNSRIPAMLGIKEYASVSQPLKGMNITVSILGNTTFGFFDEDIDYVKVYMDIIHPQCLLLIRKFLYPQPGQIPMYYKDYMTFNSQFKIDYGARHLYVELNMTPNSVLGHSVTYDLQSEGYGTLLELRRSHNGLAMPTDQVSVLEMSMSISTLYANYIQIYTNKYTPLLKKNGDLNILFECYNADDEVINYFIMPRAQATTIPLDHLVYLVPIRLIPSFKKIIMMNNPETGEKNTYESRVRFEVFMDRLEDESANRKVISAEDDPVKYVGMFTFEFNENIPPWVLSNLYEDVAECGLFTKEFIVHVNETLGVPKNSLWVLVPSNLTMTTRRYILAINTGKITASESERGIIPIAKSKSTGFLSKLKGWVMHS